MSGDDKTVSGPDLMRVVDADTLADGAMLVGHAQGEAVILARRRPKSSSPCGTGGLRAPALSILSNSVRIQSRL